MDVLDYFRTFATIITEPMKIITYSKDGRQKSVKEYPDFVPDYVRHFNGKSFVNITDKDIEILNDRKKSFEKSLLLFQLSIAIRHDYNNYVKAFKEKESQDSKALDFSQIIQLSQKKEFTHQISVLSKFFNSTYKHTIDHEFLEKLSTDLSGDVWIYTLWSLAIRRTENSKHSYNNIHSEEISKERVCINFFRLLHYYYYALKRLEYGLPVELSNDQKIT